MSDWSHELEIASHLAQTAGRVIMKIYQEEFPVMLKAVNDPVTQADQQANAIIVEGLRNRFPQDSIVAEESPLPSSPLTSERVWYVDPLDGTKEFIAHNGEFSIMIGLAIGGHSTLGVVFWPTRNQLFGGITDYAAWREEDGTCHELKTVPITGGHNLSLVTSRSHHSPVLSNIQQTLSIRDECRMGSVGLKIAHIAQGKADLYIEPGPFTRAWDACAPEAILRGAGGCFTDIHGKPIQYGRDDFRNLHGLVGSTRACHSSVVHALTGLCSTCEG